MGPRQRQCLTLGASFMMIAAAGILGACAATDANGEDRAGGAFADTDAGDTNPVTNPGNGADAGTLGAAESDAAPEVPEVGSIVLVHASRNLPAFRVCIGDLDTQLPLPDDRLMPNANVVGVDIGTAVHIGSLTSALPGAANVADASVIAEGGNPEAGFKLEAGTSGTLYVLEEKLVRPFYPQGSDAKAWPSCGALVAVLAQNGYEGHGLYTLHGDAVQTAATAQFIAIEGCLPDNSLSVAECGSTFTTAAGNLRYEILSTTTNGASPGVLDFVAANLSPGVTGGSIQYTDATSVTMGPVNLPASGFISGSGALPSLPSDFDKAIFALGGGTAVTQSLAVIQATSSPRDLPQTFYALDTNFAVFVIGDPAVPFATDAQHGLHFLAVPTQDPLALAAKADGG